VQAGDNVVRFVPPLIITEEQVDEALGMLKRALDSLAAEAA
jgi:acetylornithine/succinyldiaminopimelate/putrescine aminotransferase